MSRRVAPPPAVRSLVMLRLLCLMLGADLCGTGHAVAANPLRWRWCNPTPHGNHVYDMATRFGLTVHAGDRGQLYASSDLVLWEPLNSGTTNALRAVTFLGDRLLVTGENGTVLWADSLAAIQPGTLNPATNAWLEGVASSGANAVAVGDNGAIYLTPDGTNWSLVSVSFSDWLSSVAFGPAKGYVAVGEAGTIAYSLTGSRWTRLNTSPTANYLYRVRYLNNRFWAMGEKGTLLFSDTGTNGWSLAVSGATNNLFDMSADPLSYVLVGDTEVRTGVPPSMTNELDPAQTNRPPRWTYYAVNWLTNEFLLGGRSGMTVYGFRTNLSSGFQWDTHSDSVYSWLWDVMRLPGMFYVTVGDLGTILTSSDGISWNLELPPPGATNAVLLGVGGDTNGLVAVGNKGSILYSPSFLTNVVSTNLVGTNVVIVTNVVNTIGTLWYSALSPTTNDLQGVALFGNLLVVGGAQGTILTSSNRGTNWTKVSTPTSALLSGLAAGSNVIVAVGSSGTILSSENATTWTSRNPGTPNWIYRVRNLGGLFCAVGENGVMYTSANGTNWLPQTSGTSRWLNDAVRVTDTNSSPIAYYVVGNQGTVLWSTNGNLWTNIGTITGKSLYGAAHNGGGQLLAVGYEGSLLRSQTVPILDAPRIVNYSRGVSQSAFLISGKPDQTLSVDRTSDSTNFVNWVTGPHLEILDSSGTILYLEQNQTNDPPIRYYENKVP